MVELTLVPRRTPSGVALEAFHVRSRHASLGRGAHCDWVLPDPQRLLSKRHCEIVWRNDAWMITDLSSNGTTVGGRTLPPGVPHELHDGDRVGCGSYEVDVVFGSRADDEPTRTDTVPPGMQDTLVNGPVPQQPNPFEGSDFPPGREKDTALARGMPTEETVPVFGTASPRYGRSSVDTLSIIHPFDFALGANDGVFDLGQGTPSSDVSAVPPQTSGLHDAFEPPRPAAELLPEDWNSLETDEAAPKGADLPAPREQDARAAPSSAVISGLPKSADAASPAPTALDSPHGVQERAAHLHPQQMETHRTPVLEPIGSSGSGSTAAIVAAFMRGAGLDGVPSESAEAFFEGLGKTFRSFVAGLRRAMIARAEVKGEFRIDQTMIQPFGNNPLKFAVDDDDALAALLGVGRRTGVSAPDAVADALRDIQVHEMAVTRAIEPAVREFLAANGPEAVLELLSYNAERPLSILRRAKAWTTYVRHYQETIDTATETLDGAFGRAFGRAYEAARAELEARGNRGAVPKEGGMAASRRMPPKDAP